MRVGGIGSAMVQPYIYNTNTVSRNSLNKVSGISDDVTKSKTDFSGLSESGKNTNPLRMGETKDFAGILAQQFFTGQMNAARVIKVADEMKPEEFVQNKVENQAADVAGSTFDMAV